VAQTAGEHQSLATGLPTLLGGKRLRVYHIEDSADDRLLFTTACKTAKVPMDWEFAHSPPQGIAYLKELIPINRTKSKLKPLRPDLVVVDIHMPLLSGLEALGFMRATPELKTMPVIVLTGNLNTKLAAQAYQAGANSFMIKPCSFLEMVEAMKVFYEHWSRVLLPAR